MLATSLPPKAPMPVKHIKHKPPLRSLSWGGGTKPHATESQQPQRRSTFSHQPLAADHHGGMSQNQPVQQSSIQQWLCEEQSSAACDIVDIRCVRQGVLQEVLQAVTLSTNATTSVDFNNLTVQVRFWLTFCIKILSKSCCLFHKLRPRSFCPSQSARLLSVQAVAEVAKRQITDVSEAAMKEKEAAVSKCIQSVQRRASKEALQQVRLRLMQSHLLPVAFVVVFMWCKACVHTLCCSCSIADVCGYVGDMGHAHFAYHVSMCVKLEHFTQP